MTQARKDRLYTEPQGGAGFWFNLPPLTDEQRSFCTEQGFSVCSEGAHFTVRSHSVGIAGRMTEREAEHLMMQFALANS